MSKRFLLESYKIRRVVLQNFITNGTYTPSKGMLFVKVTCVGGGAGGGGATAANVTAAGGGGSGGTAISSLSAVTVGASQTVTIGAGGAGGIGANTGAVGGDTSLGTDRKSTRLNSSHIQKSRMPSSA